jgi:hypothetical protein
MAPNSTAWGATFIRYWPERYNQGVQVLRFYDPELDPLSLRDPSYHSCVLLVSAHDANGDGQNESWDFEPIPTLGESTNVAWVWRLDKIYTYFGWFYVPFKLTVQRLT